MTILVTGGAGYIGSHMVQELVEAGHPTVVLDNLSTGQARAVAKRAQLIVGDVGDQNLVTTVIQEHGVDAIIHFAASSVVPDSIREPLRYYSNNTSNSRNLLECAVKAGVRHFVFSSTAAVYGDSQTPSVHENSPTVPMSPYGRSKLMTEMMLRDLERAHNLHYMILRYFNVAGSDPEGRIGQSSRNATHLIKKAVQTALGLHEKIQVFGADYPTPDGTCIRDYIHVCDLVRAHSDALQYLRAGGSSETLNCGYGHGSSVLEVIEAVKQASGVNLKVELANRRDGDPACVVADSTQIRSKLDWRPRYDDLLTIVTHALAWERKLITLPAEQTDMC